MAIYEVNGSYVCSAYECYLPGSYQTRHAANLAFRVDPSVLSTAWESKRDSKGVIHDEFTEDDVRALVAQTLRLRMANREGGKP